ncbi:RNA polymerase sigma factor RpoD/SigA [Planomicrobium sp. CPCC 101110]|uniref:sigma-70 family RNA polymerase sigma factor n=1 Tax=Planomicrobium sp. CPCC 101110 TaxID=2599619 RepID=UPI0011B7A11B|nr:sigma-70 family RNA polymerase sigma factor [Planomicrobium sp. CPCC 101110]TWT25303.1 sigma-70 family RNA polymerase sigma factor [Planomicrobium sp. CPCC 101110]
MNNQLNDLLSYINDNLRFGSKIKQDIVDQWFKEYTLEIEERFTVYDELDSLKIEIIDHPKTTLKAKLLKLFKCIEQNNEINKSILTHWFNQNSINEYIQESILSDLAKRDYIIIDDTLLDERNADFDIPDYLLEDDLDSLLDDTSFINHVDSLEEIIDKSRNIEYLTQIHADDELKRIKALSNLVEANKKLVWKVVRKYSSLSTVGFDEKDMYQVGVIGLLKAAEKFDVSLGNQFSTYAIWWVRQAITRGIADYSTTIRIPVHYREKMNKFIRIENELWNELARPATAFEISKEMKESNEVIEELRFYIAQSNLDSLDRLVGEEETTSLGEFVLDENFNTPDVEYLKIELRNTIGDIFQLYLTERETQVLNYRFGFKNEERKTLEDIGLIFNVTRERIRQIEAKALKKLQKQKISGLLREYLNEH